MNNEEGREFQQKMRLKMEMNEFGAHFHISIWPRARFPNHQKFPFYSGFENEVTEMEPKRRFYIGNGNECVINGIV